MVQKSEYHISSSSQESQSGSEPWFPILNEEKGVSDFQRSFLHHCPVIFFSEKKLELLLEKVSYFVSSYFFHYTALIASDRTEKPGKVAEDLKTTFKNEGKNQIANVICYGSGATWCILSKLVGAMLVCSPFCRFLF